MRNYDFNILSPYEFELISRDLLQKELSIYLESFGKGIDSGIDLRGYSHENLIVQCKNYKDFSSLFANLKTNEVSKVETLKPDRYILTTAVSLNPSQKAKMKKLFEPFILSDQDIYGKEDLNNLLGRFREIEKDYYKLWMASTHILENIINSQVVNQSRFILDEIKNKISIYVPNQSFEEALNVLQKNNYVVISGMPGIGKTTLAEILIFHLLGEENTREFVYLSESIQEGFKLYKEEQPQIFLFDDFLGKNFLSSDLKTNEENAILKFIERIKGSTNKTLIFTTREYILNQAKQRFERFDHTNFANCVIDLSKYTTIVRAQILYNHFYTNKIPFEFVKEIIKQDQLFTIINHRNYSPRIIEYFTKNELWRNWTPQEFPKAVIDLFKNPFLIWQHVFENQVSDLSRVILINLLLVNDGLSIEKLEIQTKKYLKNNGKLGLLSGLMSFKSSLKELQNSMIKISGGFSKNHIVNFQNPSVYDFLVSYLNENTSLKATLLQSFTYLKPVLDLMAVKKLYTSNRIKLNRTELNLLEKYIMRDFDNLELDTGRMMHWHNDDIQIVKIYECKDLTVKLSKEFENFLFNKFNSLIYSANLTFRMVPCYLHLLIFFGERLKLKMGYALQKAIEFGDWNFEDLLVLNEIQINYPDQYYEFLEKNEDELYDVIEDIAFTNKYHDDLEEGSNTLEDKKGRLFTISDFFNHNLNTYIEELEEKIDEISALENEYYDDDYYPGGFSIKSNANSDSSSIFEINNMFGSLE